MDLEQKKRYLEKFHKAYYKYIQLDEDIKNVKSVDLTKTPTPNAQHMTLTEKIYKRDVALEDVFNAQREIESLCNGNPYVMLKYASFNLMSDKEIANFFFMSIKELDQSINKAILDIDI